ncbi:MAG TPA: SDR family NAD(P)-dependent oxidoreductase [Candidatus Acidoferrales bacterium]|nr:SDR family NAD(P)-dependent oxidoreductase [Candidatus Acidoferrales bacterium]
MGLRGKVAIITGASKGIGKAIAEHYGREGAKLIISARHGEMLHKTNDELKSNGVESMAVIADMAREDDVKKLVKTAADTFGRIDVLVNNAGFGVFKPVSEMTTGEYDELFDVNMRGTFIATREVLKYMTGQNDGVIINIASLAGKNAVENGAAYAATKWAMLGFGKSLMLEVRKYNIRVITICPGSVDTDFSFGHSPNRDRVLKPEDVAEAAVLAASLPARAMMSEIDLRPTNPK